MRLRVWYSLAGLSADPESKDLHSALEGQGVVVRRGGFGGVEGLAQFLDTESIDVIVDATHKRARRMQRSARRAADQHGLPLWRLEPESTMIAQIEQLHTDLVHRFSSPDTLIETMPQGVRLLAALGGGALRLNSPWQRFWHARPDVTTTVRVLDSSTPSPFPHVHPVAFSRFASMAEENRGLDGHDMLACRETILGRNLVQCALKRRMHVWVETDADSDHSPLEPTHKPQNFRLFKSPEALAKALREEAMRAKP